MADRQSIWTACALLMLASWASADTVDFRRDVLPILSQNCFKCHQGRDASAGYRLDLRAELLGETNGQALVKIGDSQNSRLIRAVTAASASKRMPRKAPPLSEQQISVLRLWIDQGLAWDDSILPATAADHWSFRPVVRPALPQARNKEWTKNAIDAFIAARHEKLGLIPAAEASRRVLIRRLSFDLRGLSPTVEEVNAFLADNADDAYERLVDRMLASPAHGERWARHWLDVARWAESEGYESNHLRPYAWRYRDYVVNAFNSDKPYDQFIREQLAGDEMTPYSDERLIATGFLAAARLSSNEEDKWRQRNDMLVDIVNATSSAFLGLTMNCAQCHNHKFDPITLRDYYSLQGFFITGQPANLALREPALWQPYLAKKSAEYDAALALKNALFERGRANRIAEAEKELLPEQRAAYEIPADRRTDEQERLAREADLKFQFTPLGVERGIPAEDRKLYDELKNKIARMEKDLPDKPQTFAFYSPVTSPHKIDVLPMKGFYPLPYEPVELARARAHMLLSGDVHRRSAAVTAAVPQVLDVVRQASSLPHKRLDLADWLARPENPLTARVWVNRLWHYHFGRGIVATPSDFGVKGSPPSHPELLDWLASELVLNGWSTKHIHRLIVTSRTYRQASQPNDRNAAIDADNRFLWRWQPRRLEAEAVRDALLAVSGELDTAVGGPGAPRDVDSLRRSLYLLQKRDDPTPVAALFDGPAAALESCACRHISTVPLQALYLLNNDFALKRAEALARRLRHASNSRDDHVEQAFQIVLGRLPDAAERERVSRFFAQQKGEAALLQFCHALVNLNEFLYIE